MAPDLWRAVSAPCMSGRSLWSGNFPVRALAEVAKVAFARSKSEVRSDVRSAFLEGSGALDRAFDGYRAAVALLPRSPQRIITNFSLPLDNSPSSPVTPKTAFSLVSVVAGSEPPQLSAPCFYRSAGGGAPRGRRRRDRGGSAPFVDRAIIIPPVRPSDRLPRRRRAASGARPAPSRRRRRGPRRCSHVSIAP